MLLVDALFTASRYLSRRYLTHTFPWIHPLCGRWTPGPCCVAVESSSSPIFMTPPRPYFSVSPLILRFSSGSEGFFRTQYGTIFRMSLIVCAILYVG
jgi:hypothetical protein